MAGGPTLYGLWDILTIVLFGIYHHLSSSMVGLYPNIMSFWTNHHQSNNVEGCQAGREGTSGIRMTGMGDGDLNRQISL